MKPETLFAPERIILFVIACLFTGLYSTLLHAEDKIKPSESMNNARLDVLIKRIDKKAKGQPGYWQFNIEGKRVLVITDEKANRMRIISPVSDSAELSQKQLYRIMQANFDSALDARYAVAKGVLWSAFIHPLTSLSDEEFLVGVGQVVNLVSNYGDSYSSGALIFGGGDSKGLRKREVIDDLLEKGLTV